MNISIALSNLSRAFNYLTNNSLNLALISLSLCRWENQDLKTVTGDYIFQERFQCSLNKICYSFASALHTQQSEWPVISFQGMIFSWIKDNVSLWWWRSFKEETTRSVTFSCSGSMEDNAFWFQAYYSPHFSPRGCPGAEQVSEGYLALWPGAVFPEAISIPHLLSQFQSGDRHRKGRSFFFTFLEKPWVLNCPLFKSWVLQWSRG